MAFVSAKKKLQPPDYLAIRKANDERLKREAEEATRLGALQREQEAQAVTYTPPAPATIPADSCAAWIASAGITDTANAMWLINKESGCNPYAVNPSSGACGVAQELPCGKSGCVFGDGACSVAWMNRYVLDRYGSWANAVGFHRANNWY